MIAVVFILALICGLFYYKLYIENKWRITEGIVVSSEKGSYFESSYTDGTIPHCFFVIEYDYTVEGKKYSSIGRKNVPCGGFNKCANYQAGDKIKIQYNPSRYYQSFLLQ